MGEKKKIKNIKDNSSGNDGATITVFDLVPPNPTPPDETFEQAGYKALGFNIGDIINTESIIVPGSATPVIVNARRIKRGTVLTVTDANTGTIEENKSKKVINFVQPYAGPIGIVTGAEVKYDLVRTSVGGEMAVNVEILA
ncbi:MAG: hypothetical protein M3R17_14150 [Bacteroidota bacterium]|nr:hypothetical protein [Bacteroidota bacterium]